MPTRSFDLFPRLAAIVGMEHVRADADALRDYGMDALQISSETRADAVVFPGSTQEIAAIAALCHAHRIPLTPRGAGTGYSGGAVPRYGGVVLSLARLNRILEIDQRDLLAVVEPHVVTHALQEAVEARGLFYPPDPASLDRSVLGGNVAECAGGPRAFKYGTTKRYVLGLQAVLASGEVIRTGGRTVKNVVGYDLTQLLVGSEGTLAIVTQIILRLIPRPPARVTVSVAFSSIPDAVATVQALLAERVVPAALELIDRESLDAVAASAESVAVPPRTGALLLIELDGMPGAVRDELARVTAACARGKAVDVREAESPAERDRLWAVRRELSLALRTLAPQKINHDVVVPPSCIPRLFDVVETLRRRTGLPMPSFGHVGDGNIHVNILLDPSDAAARARAAHAERTLFEEVVALGGSISGEHGIGFSKARFLDLELTPETIALMRRVKQAFDPRGILNPGKIFPDLPQAGDRPDPPFHRNGR